jgi:hypothetical protein
MASRQGQWQGGLLWNGSRMSVSEAQVDAMRACSGGDQGHAETIAERVAADLRGIDAALNRLAFGGGMPGPALST